MLHLAQQSRQKGNVTRWKSPPEGPWVSKKMKRRRGEGENGRNDHLLSSPPGRGQGWANLSNKAEREYLKANLKPEMRNDKQFKDGLHTNI